MSTPLKPPEYDLELVTDNVVYGKLLLQSANQLVALLSDEITTVTKLEPASIGDTDDEELYPDIRKASLHWLEESDEAIEFIDQLVDEINIGFYDLDISDNAIEYQYTIYNDPSDHYDWHQDYYDDDDDDEFVRTLSISVCLSSSELYDGAEFFIKDGNDLNVRTFKMQYGDFIVFPSTCEHRVNMLREGERISLVIWYGHYK